MPLKFHQICMSPVSHVSLETIVVRSFLFMTSSKTARLIVGYVFSGALCEMKYWQLITTCSCMWANLSEKSRKGPVHFNISFITYTHQIPAMQLYKPNMPSTQPTTHAPIHQHPCTIHAPPSLLVTPNSETPHYLALLGLHYTVAT